MSRKIRKQIYLDEEHDRALKRRAADLGVSESEVIRRALDQASDQAGSDVAALASWDDAMKIMRERASLPASDPLGSRVPTPGSAVSPDKTIAPNMTEEERRAAWREEVRYMRERAEKYPATGEPVRWSREEMYDERYADKFSD